MAGRNMTWLTVCKSLAVSRKVNHRVAIGSSHLTPGYTPNRNENVGLANTLDIKQALCTRIKTWKQLKCPATEEQKNSRYYI